MSTAPGLGNQARGHFRPEATRRTALDPIGRGLVRQRRQRHFGNKTQTSNLNAQYVVLSPHGTNPDETGGCCPDRVHRDP